MSTPVALQFVMLMALIFSATAQHVGLEQSWRALEAGEDPACQPNSGGNACSLKAVEKVDGLACGGGELGCFVPSDGAKGRLHSMRYEDVWLARFTQQSFSSFC
jgi:hypothetical protein